MHNIGQHKNLNARNEQEEKVCKAQGSCLLNMAQGLQVLGINVQDKRKEAGIRGGIVEEN